MIRIHLRNPKFALKTGKRKKKEPTEEGSVTTTSPLKEHARHAFLRFGPICIMGLIEPNTRNKALVTSTPHRPPPFASADGHLCLGDLLPRGACARSHLGSPRLSLPLLLSYLSTCTCCCPWCGVPLSADPTSYVTHAQGHQSRGPCDDTCPYAAPPERPDISTSPARRT